MFIPNPAEFTIVQARANTYTRELGWFIADASGATTFVSDPDARAHSHAYAAPAGGINYSSASSRVHLA